jgi:hypothetical protein
MGYTYGSQYIYFDLSPGEHKIMSKADHWAEIKISVKPGDIIFIKQDPSMGMVTFNNKLITLQDYEGKYYVKTLDIGTFTFDNHPTTETALAREHRDLSNTDETFNRNYKGNKVNDNPVYAGAPSTGQSLPQTVTSQPIFSREIENPSFSKPADPLKYALVIGIEKYANAPAATFAERDADTVKAYLKAMGYPERNIIMLKGHAATKSGILKYLDEWFPRNVKPESTVFVYYSGHGSPDAATGNAYIVPEDGDLMFLPSTAIPLKKFYDALKTLKVREIIVAMDSCFSGAGERSAIVEGTRPLVVVNTNEGTIPGNMVSICSASGMQISGVDKISGHGLFTYCLLKQVSINEKSGKAFTAGDVFDSIKTEVEDEARRQNREQTPVFKGNRNLEIF